MREGVLQRWSSLAVGTGSTSPSAVLTSGGYEEVLWLDVPMDDVVLVAPVDCFDQLVDVLPNLWSWCQCVSNQGHTLRGRDDRAHTNDD
jgi:hypothetical protein